MMSAVQNVMLILTKVKYQFSNSKHQCKEIEENNRMGKTKDLLKKTGDIKGPFHTKMGTIKNRNVEDLREREEIKKSWQGNTEELYKQVLVNQIATMVWSLT